MSDQRFRHTVILMVRHSKDGAQGIVMNRPASELAVTKMLEALGLVRLFAGGSVQLDACFIVHSADYHRPGTVDIDGRVAMTTNPDVLRDIGCHQGPRQSLVAFGYAGWGPGHLEGELALGGWFTVPEDPHLVFDDDRDKLWDKAMKHRTISL